MNTNLSPYSAIRTIVEEKTSRIDGLKSDVKQLNSSLNSSSDKLLIELNYIVKKLRKIDRKLDLVIYHNERRNLCQKIIDYFFKFH